MNESTVILSGTDQPIQAPSEPNPYGNPHTDRQSLNHSMTIDAPQEEMLKTARAMV